MTTFSQADANKRNRELRKKVISELPEPPFLTEKIYVFGCGCELPVSQLSYKVISKRSGLKRPVCSKHTSKFVKKIKMVCGLCGVEMLLKPVQNKKEFCDTCAATRQALIDELVKKERARLRPKPKPKPKKMSPKKAPVVPKIKKIPRYLDPDSPVFDIGRYIERKIYKPKGFL